MESERIPFLDQDLEYVGVGKLRHINIESLKHMQRPMLIMAMASREGEQKPLAVIIGYQQYLIMQELIVQVMLGRPIEPSNIGQPNAQPA